MRVLHIIVDLDVGGAELMLKRLIEACHSKNTEAVVVSLTSLGSIGVALRQQGISVHALEMSSPLSVPTTIWRLFWIIRRYKPSIVQTWMYHADLLGGLAARLAGTRNIIWGVRTTDIDTSNSRVTSIIRKMCAILSHILPHTIICVAQASRQSHIAIGYDAERMVVIPNGFDLTRLVATFSQRQALRSELNFGTDSIVVGFLGRFHPDKGQHNFVQAAGLVARRKSNLKFLMVGRDLDSNNLQLALWIGATGLAERFVLLGERADVPVCLAAMDVFCLSSRTEAFPSAVGEAMAMGLPCVVTNVGDAAMLLADTGIVVPGDDPSALARGIERLAEMLPEARGRLGQRAKARIQGEFSMERCAERFESVYRNVVARGKV
jgi:glycosyltransferase involved in cell wall biosynthesis